MAPTVHIIRHAEGYHQNFAFTARDPQLTDKGSDQCLIHRKEFERLDVEEVIACILASPMTRAMHTAARMFPNYNRGKIVVLPTLQEHGDYPCNRGSSREDLESIFGTDDFDYSLVKPDWNDKSPNSMYSTQNVRARALAARLYLRGIAMRYKFTNSHIFIVSHQDFIQEQTMNSGPSFQNAEYRDYVFADLDDGRLEDQAKLIETDISITRRQNRRLEEYARIIEADKSIAIRQTGLTSENSRKRFASPSNAPDNKRLASTRGPVGIRTDTNTYLDTDTIMNIYGGTNHSPNLSGISTGTNDSDMNTLNTGAILNTPFYPRVKQPFPRPGTKGLFTPSNVLKASDTANTETNSGTTGMPNQGTRKIPLFDMPSMRARVAEAARQNSNNNTKEPRKS